MSRGNRFRFPLRSGTSTGRKGNLVFLTLTAAAGVAIVALLLSLVVALLRRADQSIAFFGPRFLWIRVWEPTQNVFGVLPFVVGTLVTSAIALALGIPLALGAAVFLTQQAPRALRRPVGQMIELLAAIPSIVYGFWGLIVLVPIMRYDVEPVLKGSLGWTGAFNGTPIGLDVLTAGLVLTIMIVPTITAVSRDAMSAVPVSQREAALGLGATDWEATRRAVIPYARSGIFAGIILGLGRAMGETMAVTLLIGNHNAIPMSLFSQGQTISSLIANEFLEAYSPLELSALVEAGLVLLIITLAVNIVARTVLWRFQRGRGVGYE